MWIVLWSSVGMAANVAVDAIETTPGSDGFVLVPSATVEAGSNLWAKMSTQSAVMPRRPDGSVGGFDLTATADGSLTLIDRLMFNFSLPVQVLGGVGDGRFTPHDAKVLTRVNVVGDAEAPFSLGMQGNAWLPSGDPEQGTGDQKPRVQGRAMTSGNSGKVAYAANFGYLSRGYVRSNDLEVGDSVVFGMAAGMQLSEKLYLGPEVAGLTMLPDADNTTTGVLGGHSSPIEAVISTRYRVGNTVIGGMIGRGLTPTPGTSALRTALTFSTEVVDLDPDRDLDGVSDANDACPDDAGVETLDARTNGCADTDADGIFDPFDACPDTSGIASDHEAGMGCADIDGDDIVDIFDACPSEAGPAHANTRIHGCPDADGDEVADGDDACPDVAGLPHSDRAVNGCADSDGDGVYDPVDACLTNVGRANDDYAWNGCPEDFQITVPIQFEPAGTRLDDEAEALLVEVKKALASHDIAAIEIVGHTDDVGDPLTNLWLSEKRAESVRAWILANTELLERQVIARGAGSLEPVALNLTEQGRTENRRVDFHVVNAFTRRPMTPPDAQVAN